MILCVLGVAGGSVAAETKSTLAPLTVVAQESQAKQQGFERTIGTCQPIENKLESKMSAINSVAPVGPAEDYLQDKNIDVSVLMNAKITMQRPTHGALQGDESGSFMYVSSDYQYEGQDSATALVEMGGYKIGKQRPRYSL